MANLCLAKRVQTPRHRARLRYRGCGRKGCEGLWYSSRGDLGYHQTSVSIPYETELSSLTVRAPRRLHHHAKVAESYADSCGNAGLDYYDLVSCRGQQRRMNVLTVDYLVVNALASSVRQH